MTFFNLYYSKFFLGFSCIFPGKVVLLQKEITTKDVMRILNYHINNKLMSGYLSDTQRFTPPPFAL